MHGYWRNLLAVGIKSAWTNRLPMVVLWLSAVVLAVSYWNFPRLANLLEPIRQWQIEFGWPAAALNAAFFCGIVPGAFQLSLRALRPRRPLRVICAQVVLSAVSGVLCWNFYRFQAWCFGANASLGTLATKTFVDQFVWTPLVIAPLNAVSYFAIARDFSWTKIRSEWPSSFVRDVLLPHLVTMWCVNVIPNFAMYAFPPALQSQLVGLLFAFWTLMCFQIALQSGRTTGTSYSPKASS